MKHFLIALVASMAVSAAHAQMPTTPDMSDEEINAIAEQMTEEQYEAEMQRAQTAVDNLSAEERAQATEGLLKMMEGMSEEEKQLMYDNHPLLKK